MAEMKFSRQREAIKSFLKTRKDHPTAETVYKNVRKEYPNISLGTVYRNLTLLSEKREINKLSFNDGADHFDADTSRHYHFICTRCKAVMDLPAKVVRDEDFDKDANSGFSGKITGHVTYFEGLCPACLKKESLA